MKYQADSPRSCPAQPLVIDIRHEIAGLAVRVSDDSGARKLERCE
jgi:hypothetical protein